MIPSLIDELPLLAVVGSQIEGGIRIRDASELRLKESDRLATTAANLRAMGAEVEEFPDGLSVSGPTQLHGALARLARRSPDRDGFLRRSSASQRAKPKSPARNASVFHFPSSSHYSNQSPADEANDRNHRFHGLWEEPGGSRACAASQCADHRS